jgi:hypothetical protein
MDDFQVKNGTQALLSGIGSEIRRQPSAVLVADGCLDSVYSRTRGAPHQNLFSAAKLRAAFIVSLRSLPL